MIQLNDWIWYVNQGLYTNDYNLDNFTYIDNYFFRSILSYFSNEYLNNKSNDSVLKENYNNVPYDYIKKYFYIFINDNKKITYYQDLIYMDLLKIYMSPKSGDYLFTDIEDYYKNLKLLSKKDYTEMLKVLLYFKSKFLLSNKIESIEAELKYDKILSSVFSFQKIEWDYMLYYIFNLYDLWNKDNFFDGLISFTDTYFKKNWLKIQKDKLLWYDKTKNIKLWYYISFLDNIIKSYLISNSNNSEEIKGVFSILNKYALLSVSVYSDWDKDKKRTIIVLHLNLLKALSEYIRNNFFEKEMDKWIMLVKNKELILDQSIISLLEKSYNTLFNFFTANKVAFDENIESDSLNLNDYDYLSLNYIEYLSALTNYDKYKIAKSDLYRIETIWWDNVKKIIYTVWDIKTYLENFNWVKSESIDIKTDETWNIYSVSINIWWKDFSFDLSPYNNYSISNIYLDWVKKNSTYSLNLIKEKMDQKFESATNEKEKNTNDFRNFFINTFLYKPNPVTPPTDEDPILPKETTDIMVFKRDKLLWSRWEFSNILDFAQIRPENIIVNIINQKISIKVRNVKTSSTFNLWNESNTYWTIFDSDYSIAVNEHYFNNAKFKLYKNIKDWNRVTEYYWLWEDKYIVINGNIWIWLFKEYISSLVSYYNYIIFVNDVLVKKVGQIDISVNSSKIVKYSFMYSWKNYEILLLKNSIISIKRDWEKINSSTLDYTELQNRIDLFIK